MNLLAIDPGPAESACVLYDLAAGVPRWWAKEPNPLFLSRLDHFVGCQTVAIEMIASYGMPVGQEVFETCVWVGRFIERWERSGGDHQLVYRQAVKLHVCGDTRAKDTNIRQALIDRYGGKAAAVGLKKTPGPLYGLTGDCWSALAVAVTAAEALNNDASPAA